MIRKKEINACKQGFNDKHDKYIEKKENKPLDCFLTLDYSMGYSDIYPLKDSLEKILKIKDHAVKILALKARYAYPAYPSVNKETEKSFIKVNLYGSKFLSEHPDWILTYAQISNFIDELVEKKIVLIEDSFVVDKNASIEQIISGALPYIVSTFVESGNEVYMIDDIKNYITWLTKFSKYKDEFSKLKDSLNEKDYLKLVNDSLRDNTDAIFIIQ